jgi:hypothetical protein
VLLSQRKGFIKLAIDSGVTLVPVLGIGEERLGSNLLLALLLPAKRVPIKVRGSVDRSTRKCVMVTDSKQMFMPSTAVAHPVMFVTV